MRSLTSFMDQMVKFFEEAGAALGPSEEGAEAAPPDPSAMQEDNPNIFKPPADLIEAGGGPAPNPHPPLPEKFGNFQYKVFETEADLFAYVE